MLGRSRVWAKSRLFCSAITAHCARVKQVLINLLSMIVVGLLAVKFLKPLTTRLVDESLSEPILKVTRGLGWMFLVPIAFIILMVTVIGSGVAMVIAPVYVLGMVLAKILAGIVLGAWIMRLSSKDKAPLDWKPVVLGVIALEILALIPFIGWLIATWVFLLALGGLYTHLSQRMKAATK